MLTLSQALGFGNEDQLSIQKLLGAILHLGNIKMEDAGDGESSRVSSMIVAARAASLLGTTKTALAKALTTRLVAAKGDLVEANLNPARATYGRDALAKVNFFDCYDVCIALFPSSSSKLLLHTVQKGGEVHGSKANDCLQVVVPISRSPQASVADEA